MNPYVCQPAVANVKCVTTYLERVAAVRFAVNHLHDIFVYTFTSLVAITPVVCRTHTILSNVKVFRVVNILVRAVLDTIDYLGVTS